MSANYNFRHHIPSWYLKTIVEKTKHMYPKNAGFDPRVYIVVEFNGEKTEIEINEFKHGDLT